MSCILHEIGSPARLIKMQSILVKGRVTALKPFTVGIVKGIHPSNHTLNVYFEELGLEVNLPADAFEKPHMPTKSYPIPY